MVGAGADGFAGPSMEFEMLSTPSASHGRVGELRFFAQPTGAPLKTIATPALINYTRRGAPPHLTRDNVARLPCEMVSLSLEHFLDGRHKPAFIEAPFSIHRFIGLRQSDQLITMALHDPTDRKAIAPNNDAWATARTTWGAVKVSPADFLAYTLPRPPDLLFAFADDPIAEAMSLKRIRRSIGRTTRWVQHVAEGVKGKTTIFAPLVGSTSVPMRQAFVSSLLDDSEGTAIDESISGYTLDVSTALPNAVDSNASVTNLFSTSLANLPIAKPRTVLAASGPHAILRLIRDVGIDLFVEEWSSHCASVGVGLDFTFPVSQQDSTSMPKRTTTGRRDVGHNFYDLAYAEAKVTLSSSPLAASTSSDGSHPFGPSAPTQLYVHHLLHSHEMTAHVILAMHNQIVMAAFLSSVRRLLLQSPETFSQAVDDFFATYEEGIGFDGGRYECVLKAEEECERVNTERGPGSLKIKRQLDLDESIAAAQAETVEPSMEVNVV